MGYYFRFYSPGKVMHKRQYVVIQLLVYLLLTPSLKKKPFHITIYSVPPFSEIRLPKILSGISSVLEYPESDLESTVVLGFKTDFSAVVSFTCSSILLTKLVIERSSPCFSSFLNLFCFIFGSDWILCSFSNELITSGGKLNFGLEYPGPDNEMDSAVHTASPSGFLDFVQGIIH